MKHVVVDASAFAAVVFDEPAADQVRRRLEGATVHAPTLLRYELANTAWKKARRHPADARAIVTALDVALDDQWGLVWQDVDVSDVLVMALATGLTAYDAAYLWLAGSLGAELITSDRQVVTVAERFAAGV